MGSLAARRRARSLGLSRNDDAGIVMAPPPKVTKVVFPAFLRRQKKKAMAISASTPTLFQELAKEEGNTWLEKLTDSEYGYQSLFCRGTQATTVTTLAHVLITRTFVTTIVG